jgi:hypothetical protein
MGGHKLSDQQIALNQGAAWPGPDILRKLWVLWSNA